MARGYSLEEIQQKLIDVLSDSKTGLSGVEISEKLGINRATMAKYLNIFAAEGLIKQKTQETSICGLSNPGPKSCIFQTTIFT